MSKAFTRESDALEDEPSSLRRFPELPPGVKNYLTPAGEKRLREELDQLLQERSALSASSDRSLAEARQQASAHRIGWLRRTLETAVIVQPPGTNREEVRFGACVTVRESSGGASTYRIVGIAETDLHPDAVSWQSPIARALLNARVGQRIRFSAPAGEQELEIAAVTYDC